MFKMSKKISAYYYAHTVIDNMERLSTDYLEQLVLCAWLSSDDLEVWVFLKMLPTSKVNSSH